MGDFKSAHMPNQEIFDQDLFRKLVAERAYSKAEKRGFAGGHEMQDWLEAESEIKNQYFYWFQNADE